MRFQCLFTVCRLLICRFGINRYISWLTSIFFFFPSSKSLFFFDYGSTMAGFLEVILAFFYYSKIYII